jgi:phosphocarrier protein HPr
MIQQKVLVRNKIGIHSRPAALLVDTASKFKSKVTVTKGEASASAASMIRLLALKVKQDNEIVVGAEGDDEVEALKAVVGLIESKFGEE